MKKLIQANDADWTVQVYQDHAVILGYESEGRNEVSVPSEIDGKPVTEIGAGCFSMCDEIRSISLPDTIRVIGNSAFAMCRNLDELVLPDSVEQIGSYLTRDCISLKKLILPKHLEELPRSALAFTPLNDTELTLPETLKVIRSHAFYSTWLTEITLPDSVEEIDDHAFEMGPSIVHTKLPQNRFWFLIFPAGERVTDENGREGIVTDAVSLTEGAIDLTVDFGAETEHFFFPLEIGTKISFVSIENEKFDAFRQDEELVKLYELWQKGLV